MDWEVKQVHLAHCCAIHGCKYGDDDTCPVVLRKDQQDYLCEWCTEDGFDSIEQLRDYVQTIKQFEWVKNRGDRVITVSVDFLERLIKRDGLI